MVSQSYGFGSAYRGFKNHWDGKAAEHICFYNSLIIVKKKPITFTNSKTVLPMTHRPLGRMGRTVAYTSWRLWRIVYVCQVTTAVVFSVPELCRGSNRMCWVCWQIRIEESSGITLRHHQQNNWDMPYPWELLHEQWVSILRLTLRMLLSQYELWGSEGTRVAERLR